MNRPCPQCGAQLPEGESCRERFERCLAFEFEQPRIYGAVHFLTVACYMLQHNQYSRQGWLFTRRGLAQVVREGLSPGELRERHHLRLDSGRREWSVTRGEKLPGVEAVHWNLSIAGVRLDDPDRYQSDVMRWAESVLADSEPLMRITG